MAPDNLLHLLHRLRMVRPDVEAHPATYMGHLLRAGVGYHRHAAECYIFLLRHDGRAILPGLLRGWIRTGYTLPLEFLLLET